MALHPIAKISIWGVAQAITGFLIGYFIEAVASDRLLFFTKILKSETERGILDKALGIIIFFIVVHIGFYLLSHIATFKALTQKKYDRLCDLIFVEIIQNNPKFKDKDSLFKVSVLEVKKGYLKNKNKKRRFWPKKEVYLKVNGRAQIKQNGDVQSKMKFRSGEGCVGIAYKLGSVTMIEINKYDESKPQTYFNQSHKKLKLPEEKAKTLSEYACSFLCYPMKYNNSKNVYAVLSIDCMAKGYVKHIDSAVLDNIIKGYNSTLSLN